MARPDGRLEPGQPLRGAISARAWNRAQDAADIILGDSQGVSTGQVTAFQQPYTWAYCKATETVPRWGILEITGLEISPTAADSDAATGSFQDTPVLTGGTPSANTTAWGVAVEPIESGKIGRVAVSGVVQCKLNVVSTGHKYARCQSSVSQLKTGSSGDALILWKQSGTGQNKWALIRLGLAKTIVLAQFVGEWVKDGGKIVTDSGDPSITYEAKNYSVSLSVTGGAVSCVLAYVAGEWVLCQWDWHKLSNWTQTAKQVLSHNETGHLEWMSTTDCDT